MNSSERNICCFVQHPHLRELVEHIANTLGLTVYHPNSLEVIFEKSDHSFLWLIVELNKTEPEANEKLEKRFREEFSVPVTFLTIMPSEEDQKHSIEIRIALPDEPTEFLHNILHEIHTNGLVDPYCERRSELVKNYGDLSKREREVLRHVIEGKHNKEIARILNISTRTVEVHRSNILHKMKMDSFVALACSHINDSK